MSVVPEVDDHDVYATEFEGEGDWDFLDLTSNTDLGHHASIGVEFDQPREVCSPASVHLPKSVVDLIHPCCVSCSNATCSSCILRARWRP